MQNIEKILYVNTLTELLLQIETEITKSTSLILLTDENVASYWLKFISDFFNSSGIEYLPIVLPAGEKSKALFYYEEIIMKMSLSKKVHRNTPLLCLGGGVITDIGGFVASTFKRGIPFYHIPTTLLGMIDASIGGKNGINLPSGKNLLGTFAFPKKTWIFKDFLKTLPKKNYFAAYGEILKYSLLSPKSFDLPISTLNAEDLIKPCIEIKQHFVGNDPFDQKGERQLLNLGHTFAHAIETCMKENPIDHGEAVAIGICLSLELSILKFNAPENLIDKSIAFCKKFKLPYELPNEVDHDKLILNMWQDKKRQNDSLTFVLANSNGEICPNICINESMIKNTLKNYQQRIHNGRTRSTPHSTQYATAGSC